MKQRILFLTPRLPFPVIGGDRLKPYNILKHLAAKHDVTLASLYQGKESPAEYITQLEKLGLRVFVAKLNPITAALKAGLESTFKYPLEIGYYTHNELAQIVDKLINSEHFDLAFSFFMRTAEYLKNRNIKKILMAEDCRTLYQYRSFKESSNLKQKIVRYWEYRKLKSYEPKIVNYFDFTTLVTNDDINAMKKQNSNAQYRLLSNGTDIHHFLPPAQSANRKGILFAGKLDVWANELMVKRIALEIFPCIKDTVPDATLNIVGANPSKFVKSLQSDSIKVFANVASMLPFLQTAELFIHPHTGGSGIQNKLLEAMACACPVVTTPTGIQGIEAQNGTDVMLGNSNLELSSKAIELLTNRELANKIGSNSCELIRRTHSWEAVYSSLDILIDELLNK